MGRGPIHNRVKRCGYFNSLYLGNRLRYRDNSKREFNGMIFSISWVCFKDDIFSFSSRFLYEKSNLHLWFRVNAMIYRIYLYLISRLKIIASACEFLDSMIEENSKYYICVKVIGSFNWKWLNAMISYKRYKRRNIFH